MQSNSHYVVRHWQGSLPLGRTFWLSGLFAYFGWGVAAALAAKAQNSYARSAAAGLFFLTVAIFTWYGIGVWRSSGRTMRAGAGRAMAIAARAMQKSK